MKKLFSIIAVLAILPFIMSGTGETVIYLAQGDDVPELKLENSTSKFDVSSMRGKYVLITFWTSSDAVSRIQCNHYAAWANKHRNGVVEHVAVNFDNRDEIFSEIVRLDGMNQHNQYNVKGIEAERLRQAYSLQNGYGTVLVAPNGRVAAFDPTDADLAALSL